MVRANAGGTGSHMALGKRKNLIKKQNPKNSMLVVIVTQFCKYTKISLNCISEASELCGIKMITQ